MAPTILIVGATGNTGRGVTETLPELLRSNNNWSNHQIVALTRSKDSPEAQLQSKISGVEIVEKNWVDITSEWLREHEVVRAFIASHNNPNQFAEESAFHLACLGAGVKYVVRISTCEPNVRPNCKAYYPRTHWAIETLLSSAEFKDLQWTSLQPNLFSNFLLNPIAQSINAYRKTGKLDKIRLLISKDVPVAVIDPSEVGVFAAHLLSLDDVTAHNNAKYVINGPEDITGKQVVDLLEQHIGVPVEDVIYQDISLFDQYYEMAFGATAESKTIIVSAKYSMACAWEGKLSASTTSKEVLEIAGPKKTAADMLEFLMSQ